MMRTMFRLALPARGWRSRQRARRLGQGKVEAIELCALRHNFLPQRFRWRGEVYRIDQIARIWEEQVGRAPRRYFAVCCSSAHTYTLFQDLRVGTWHVVGPQADEE